jgi:coproporphyrinogen III oxidase-like Fe-S oxidoreductase
VSQFAARDLVIADHETVRLTPLGRLLSNDVFQEFLETAATEPQSASR